MCLFRGAPKQPAAPVPPPIVAQNPQNLQTSTLPTKKELLDPDEVAGVEYGTTAKSDPKGTAQKTGTDALKINLNTGAWATGAGGLNV